MFQGIDLKQLFLFPVKDAEARKHFLIGCLVSLSAFIIPILPYMALYGYAARIAKQIMNNETPRMVAWDDWAGMFKDGARMFGVRLVYSIPILIFTIPIILAAIGMPIFMENANSADIDSIIIVFTLIMFACMCLIIPLTIPLVVVIPAAEMYAVDKNEFAAGFQIREWWAIFRANIGGFIAAFAIYYIASTILVFALQIIMATLILSCLLPILLPALTIYLVLIMYATIAQAYKVGKDKLSKKETILQQA